MYEVAFWSDECNVYSLPNHDNWLGLKNHACVTPKLESKCSGNNPKKLIVVFDTPNFRLNTLSLCCPLPPDYQLRLGLSDDQGVKSTLKFDVKITPRPFLYLNKLSIYILALARDKTRLRLRRKAYTCVLFTGQITRSKHGGINTVKIRQWEFWYVLSNPFLPLKQFRLMTLGISWPKSQMWVGYTRPYYM